ncbi:hypothetical protein EWM64_g1474 [Hericium alpestre]|uniref:RBR-type E3 ubiquitin transferase n=1 Tax=Hericium alpestre TaxID=135208 RepID=A0A4Z0A9E7_9AGAM|nr:hypothetical protein EWM64_g1474 [Hericium alpestre]
MSNAYALSQATQLHLVLVEERHEFAEDSVARLEPCGHEFCRGCVRDYVKAKIEEHRFPVLCPICVVGKGKTEPGVVTGTLVLEIGITEEQHKVWTEMEMSAFSVMIHCRKCKNSMFVDKQDLEDTNTLVCPLRPCRYIWCKNCQQEITIGGPKHSCDGSSELDHLMRERGWKYCPSCRTPIQKASGCNHMTCMSPGCNTHFCYICGQMIVRSAMRNQIQNAVGAHYRVCHLFEDIPDRAVPP